MFSKYGKAKTLAPPFLWGLACARAGIPTLIVAPPSGGKSTVIFAIEEYLNKRNYPNRRISRIGLRSLKKLTLWLAKNPRSVLLNEDFALIGSSDYMTEKMGEIIGALSYSKTYQDDGLDINLNMQKLGFISGVQPFWMKRMVTNPVFITHLREKFVRYYCLPYTVSKDIDDLEAIDLLVSKTNEGDINLYPKIPKVFIEALARQLGTVRANKYSRLIASELSRFTNKRGLSKLLRFYAERIAFEKEMIEREFTEDSIEVTNLWIEYTVLYWCLRRGELTREALKVALGVSSMRSVDRATWKAISRGWITSYWNNDTKHYIASKAIREVLGWK